MADAPEQAVRHWLEDCVLALELCPFAAPVVEQDSLRIAVSSAPDSEQQLRDFLLELDRLQTASEEDIATTLLVLAEGPREFPDFLDLVASAQDLLEQAGLDEMVQLAHFHPAYCFADEDPGGVSHLTNRSPLPIIHLLRESLLTRALEAYPEAASIPERNIARLESLSKAELRARWHWLSLP